MLQELWNMDRITQLQDEIQQLLTIMFSAIAYLTSRANFVQISEEIPITKERNADKFDEPEVFEANKKELIADLILKAKQVEYLIESLPEPEREEDQVCKTAARSDEMTAVNDEYVEAVARSKDLHSQITDSFRRLMLEGTGAGLKSSMFS
ncbi:hypothetical protein C8R46DRAFT_1309494 [Mycena filopes]|nr:hypothetical protein C8R46DRAFT_1309494 [Mycena filopes]